MKGHTLQKSIRKATPNTKKTGTTEKLPKSRLGEPTFGPEGGFGSIFGVLENANNMYFERKMIDEKNVENKLN